MFIMEKQPSEVMPFIIDFSRLLNTTETITALSVVAKLDMTVKTSTVIQSSEIIEKTCRVVVKAGTDGETYKIIVLITTSQNNIYEEDFKLKIIDR
jgi:hypothetical protein